MFTAATSSAAPSPYWVATPPPTASPPWDAANSRARRSISVAAIPTDGATCCGVGSRRSRRAASAGGGAGAGAPAAPPPPRPRRPPPPPPRARRPSPAPPPPAPPRGMVQRQRLPLAVRPAGHRLDDAVRVVQPLQRRLAARAEPALVDG